MNLEPCVEIQASFSSYLDGAVSGQEMQEISRHIHGDGDRDDDSSDSSDSSDPRRDGCAACASELRAWRVTQNALAALGPAKAPADLGLKLRIAISHERARRDSRLRDKLSLMWDNVVRPRVVQVSAGLALSLVLATFVMLLGAVAAPQSVLANDEPLGAITQPHLLYWTSFPGESVMALGTSVVVEAKVDAEGRAYDYTIVSGPKDDAVRVRVEDQLLGGVFQPASAFGVPVRGRVLMTFSGISVRG
jgi:hypothetical protein